MRVDGGGLNYEPNTLTDIANKLRDGARALGSLAGSAPFGVDAGTSSEVVGKALTALVKAGATASALMETDADKVNTAKGTYDDTEADNTSSISSQDQGFENTNYGGVSYQYPG
jgi:hypothetical protein